MGSVKNNYFLKKNHGLISILMFNVLMVSIGSGSLVGQQYEWISPDFPNSRFLGVFEVDGKYFGAVSNGASSNYDPNTIYQLSMYELELYGSDTSSLNLIETISIPFPENYATIDLNYIEETQVWLIVQSAVISQEKQRYRVILCNKNFEILSEQTLDTTAYPIGFYMDTHDGKTTILGSINSNGNELFFLQYLHSNPYYLPPIIVKQSEPQTMFAISSMEIDERSEDMLVFYYGGIAKLDTNLFQTLKLEYDVIKTAFQGSVKRTETHYFSHGLAFQEIGNWYKIPVFHKYDTLFNIIAADTLGIRGGDHYPFIIKSLDYRNSKFLAGGHLDGPFAHLNFFKSIKKFYLAKFDEEMNRLWYKEYGGDRAYVLMGLKLLEDGESLAYGYVTDTKTNLWYAYILHVDTNGELLSSTDLPLKSQSNIKVVNPGIGALEIINPDGIQAMLELYDTQGSFVMRDHISLNSIFGNTRELPAGIYVYKLIHNERVIGTGKWMKVKSF